MYQVEVVIQVHDEHADEALELAVNLARDVQRSGAFGGYPPIDVFAADSTGYTERP